MYYILDEIRDGLQSAIGASFKKYYVGRVREVPVNYLPVLMVYGVSTEMPRSTTGRDKYEHTIIVEILTSAFAKINTAEDADKIMQAQKQVWDLMEDRDANNVPKTTSVLGALRGILTGTRYLYQNAYVIEYEQETVDDRVYFRGRVTLKATSQFNSRP